MVAKCITGLSLKAMIAIGAAVTAVIVVAIVVPVVVTQKNDSSSNSGSDSDSGPDSGTSSSSQSLTQGTCPNGLTYYITGMTDSDKQAVLDAHNMFRNRVAAGLAPGQAGATDMLEMRWDDGLALTAQVHENKCEFAHDTNNDRKTVNFTTAGQNLAYSGISVQSNNYNLTYLVELWYNEVYLLGGAQMGLSSYTFNTSTGHYSQLVWAKSYALGCGFKQYKSGNFYRNSLTCNYGPAGNYIGSRVYTPGTFSSTSCTYGGSIKWNSLCKNS